MFFYICRVHIWRAHLKLRPYKCKYCEYTSVLRAPIYRQHVASVHGKKDGCLDDVELLLDVAQKIDEFEKDNKYVILVILTLYPICTNSIS